MTRPIPLEELEQYILDRCILNGAGCLVWTGCKVAGGYGQLRVQGKQRYVHRVVWALKYGKIPVGLTVDHLPTCVRSCCNTDHMELVSQPENSRRGQGVYNDTCKRGHKLVGWNRMLSGNAFQCRKCHTLSQQRRREGLYGIS